MNRKLIFFDIDGTIIPEDTGVIPESTKEAIKKAKENGHLVFINTGRTFSGITQPIFDLEFNGYVCGCGTHIYFDGKKIYSSVIPKEKCIETVAILRENKVNAFYEGDKGIYFDYSYSNPFMERAKKMLRTNGKSVEVILEDKDEVFDKCLIKFTDNDIDKKDIIMPFFEANYYCIDRGEDMWEMAQKGHSKATGIQKVCEYLGADIDDCIAIGDSTNDLDMLKAVKNSVAMGNSMESIFPYCSYKTTDIKEDGIYNALVHFEII